MKMSVKNASNPTRRGLLKVFSAFAGSVFFGGKVIAQTLTPRATEGPFYPTTTMRTDDVDNELVQVIGLVRDAGGEVITLRGRITDRDGNSRVGHRIEIWQCDLNGKYLHPGDNRNVVYDQGFQGFGYDITNETGNYSFRAIKPGRYPGRTPHIHVKVFDGDMELLTTQFYVAGDADYTHDNLFRRMSDEQAENVSMVYVDVGGVIEATIDVQVSFQFHDPCSIGLKLGSWPLIAVARSIAALWARSCHSQLGFTQSLLHTSSKLPNGGYCGGSYPPKAPILGGAHFEHRTHR